VLNNQNFEDVFHLLNPSEPHKEILQTELRLKKQQLEEIIGYKIQGAIMRANLK